MVCWYCGRGVPDRVRVWVAGRLVLFPLSDPILLVLFACLLISSCYPMSQVFESITPASRLYNSRYMLT